MNYPNVIHSPIMNNTIQIKDPSDPKRKIRVGKVLLQISFHELHNYLLSDTIGLP